AYAFGGGPPAGDVRLVLISHSQRQAIERRVAPWCEMEHELMTVVQKSITVDWLVVTDRKVAREACSGPRRLLVDGDRFHPMDDVLQPEMGPRGLRDVQCGPGVGGPRPDVQEQRPVRLQDTGGARHPGSRPFEIVGLAEAVRVLVVANAEVVGRRG